MTGAADAPTVIVVDDSDDQRELLGRQFERAGCSVVLAATSEEAVAEAQRNPPDIVVIDLVMPRTDGWQTTAAIRAVAPRAAIVIASVLDVGDYPQADAVLPKPFTGEQVRAIVATLGAR